MYAVPARGQAWHTTRTLTHTRSIRALVNAGVLIRDMRVEVEGEGFWFSVPNIGAFMKCCVKGRQEVIAILKRQKHKELLQEVHSSPPPLLSRGSGSCSP